MKNNFHKPMCMMLIAIFAFNGNAQTVSDFENLTLPADSFWNGSADPLGATFTSGNASFENYYDTSFGGYWSGGWAYSNVTDSVTSGAANIFGPRAGSGYDGSSNFLVGKHNAIVKLNGSAAGQVVIGAYVTNGSYAYYSMKDGDAFGKQFGSPNDANGDPDGTNGEDWFLLTIKGWYNGSLVADSVNFYLADYRFSNNAQDYIIKTWEWVDLTSLGNVDSLLFLLNSSDVGLYGMNTPGFFCMDDFITNDTPPVYPDSVAGFENLILAPEAFWDGSNEPLGASFISGEVEFKNYYDTSFGGYWNGGWAYSNIGDSITSGAANIFGARAGSGYNGSSKFAVGKDNSVVKLNAAGRTVSGLYVTNGSYAYYSMKDGDAFGKQFGSPNDANGDPDGTNGEDWFLLTIKGWHNGTLVTDSINFYLADYRFSNNAQDYIVKTWEWVDLTSLGNVDSLLFSLNSSDVGLYGMNTPGFFCADNITTKQELAVGTAERNENNVDVTLYPNPVSDKLNVRFDERTHNKPMTVQLFDMTGKLVYSAHLATVQHQISAAEFKSGLYNVVIYGKDFSAARSFIKQ